MCYLGPVMGAIATTAAWRKTKSVKLWWLTLMLYGSALFGVIDHLWNGELFLISENLAGDLLLGVIITAITLIIWGTIVLRNKNVFQPSLCCDKIKKTGELHPKRLPVL